MRREVASFSITAGIKDLSTRERHKQGLKTGNRLAASSAAVSIRLLVTNASSHVLRSEILGALCSTMMPHSSHSLQMQNNLFRRNAWDTAGLSTRTNMRLAVLRLRLAKNYKDHDIPGPHRESRALLMCTTQGGKGPTLSKSLHSFFEVTLTD